MKTIELEIVDYGYNGEGIAKSEGKVFFVPKTITGEKVTCEIVKENAKFSQCKLKQIDTPSKVRIDAKCPYFADCGGCNFQHIDYEKELEIKKQIFLREFSKYQKLDKVELAKSENDLSYRNKIRFKVKDKMARILA